MNAPTTSTTAPVRPALVYLSTSTSDVLTLKLNPRLNAGEALGRIESVYKKYAPGKLFNYRFVDTLYAEKFGAEQRRKEIGVRKVLGASAPNLWRLLSRDFVLLVLLSLGIATPIAYIVLHQWLSGYAYHAPLTWTIFAAAGIGAMAIALLTVSVQTIKAALTNPVRSLRSE